MNIGAPGEKDQDSSATANKTYDIIDRMESTRSPRPKALLVGIQLPKVSTEEMNSSLEELRRLCDTLGYECVGFMSQRRASTSGAIVLGEGKLQELASWTGGTGKIASMVQVKKSKAAERFAAEKEAKELGEGEIDDFEDESDEDLEFSDEPESELDKSDGALQGPPEGVRADVVVFDCELSPSQLRNLESASGVQVLDRTGVIIEIFSRHARTRAARLQVEIARLKYLAPRLRETGGGGDRQGGGVGGKGAGETSLELDRR
jgi:GTP-binding protein HflX